MCVCVCAHARAGREGGTVMCHLLPCFWGLYRFVILSLNVLGCQHHWSSLSKKAHPSNSMGQVQRAGGGQSLLLDLWGSEQGSVTVETKVAFSLARINGRRYLETPPGPIRFCHHTAWHIHLTCKIEEIPSFLGPQGLD